ncbi:Ribosomal large subunit pseudouridine synthase C [Rubellimicrobium mesophilum DSM 19309]|uniref:Pseudouridine synthase n=1 Tax=Rubellimicrobium mesophilum DSM 19309 TaxID=442562 RepID=A0A017HR59_9RHOB|nr:RluA family pseudouridine synthase [Rubellimicrobium mesophilum]EYD76815.1 Ribosomal large subunit pseudouridine synthase C [Rubellimicrobium mesophilum DSM 19309]
MSGVRMLTVGADEGDQRLDRWLRKQFPNLTQGAIEKMCRKGELRVDGGRVTSATRVAEGQTVRVPPLPDVQQPAPPPSRLARSDEAMIQAAVMWKDEHIIVLNKPPGLASQGGSGQGDRHVDGLTPALMFGYKERPKLVHRLDQDTSGVLLLARTDRVARGLSEALRHRNVRKIYWAAVAGVPTPRAGTIRFGLVKEGGRGNEKMRAVHPREVEATPGAKRAVTEFATIENAGGRLSWVAMQLVTGRTHQLRAHMAEIGHPILGDGKYGGSAQENLGDGWGAGVGGDLSRKLHLHARTLIVEHPITKAMLTLTAPLPPHMKATWDYLGWNEKDAPLDPFENRE